MSLKQINSNQYKSSLLSDLTAIYMWEFGLQPLLIIKKQNIHSFLIILKNINFGFMVLAKYLGRLILSMKSLSLLPSNNLVFVFKSWNS